MSDHDSIGAMVSFLPSPRGSDASQQLQELFGDADSFRNEDNDLTLNENQSRGPPVVNIVVPRASNSNASPVIPAPAYRQYVCNQFFTYYSYNVLTRLHDICRMTQIDGREAARLTGIVTG